MACFCKSLQLFSRGLPPVRKQGAPYSPWTSEKWWIGIGRLIFQLLYSLGGSTLRGVLHHPPGLPGEIKPHTVAMSSRSLMLPQLTPFPSLPFLFFESPPNETTCTSILTQAIFQHEPFRTVSIWFLQQCTCNTWIKMEFSVRTDCLLQSCQVASLIILVINLLITQVNLQ